MSETLEKLYFGMLKPFEEEPYTVVYAEAIRECRDFEEQILKLIGSENEELMQCFKIYKNSMEGVAAQRAEDMFYRGFRLGGKLLVETLSEKK